MCGGSDEELLFHCGVQRRKIENGQSKIKMEELKLERVLLLQHRHNPAYAAAFSPNRQQTISLICKYSFLWITIYNFTRQRSQPRILFLDSILRGIFPFFQWPSPSVRPRLTGTSTGSSSFSPFSCSEWCCCFIIFVLVFCVSTYPSFANYKLIDHGR